MCLLHIYCLNIVIVVILCIFGQELNKIYTIMYQNNIKNLYGKASNKRELTLLIAQTFNMNPLSVKNHWLSGFYQVPEKHQDRCIRIMQNFIKVESQLLTH